MGKTITIRKGLDIKLKGKTDQVIQPFQPKLFGIKPTDFLGVFPKLLVKEGDKVKAGTPLFYDKYNEKVLFTSTVSGTVKGINRGAKRVLEEIVIESDSKNEYEEFDSGKPESMGKEKITELLLKSGNWPSIRQRPYSTIANPDDTPDALFISTFDTSPLAPDYDFLIQDKKEQFQVGLDVLKTLTGAPIYLNFHESNSISDEYTDVKGTINNTFRGPHPAGNVGIQIHHLRPINKGDIIWYINPIDVVNFGRLFLEGKYNTEMLISIAGSEVKKTKYFKSFKGPSITEMLKDNVTEGELRYISGNVFTGKQISAEGYVGYYERMVTVIPEGKYYEFFGWAKLGLKAFSFHNSFPSKLLFPKREYSLDTNYHGGVRAFLMSGEYEKVFPMNIMPVQLLKAILINDIDLMEQLGIYEVDEEDFALCEVICTSKIEVQSIVRKGLNTMIKEMS